MCVELGRTIFERLIRGQTARTEVGCDEHSLHSAVEDVVALGGVVQCRRLQHARAQRSRGAYRSAGIPRRASSGRVSV
jgi:hypothetical protein